MAGETDMQRMNVKKIEIHPDYSSSTLDSDFSLLNLENAVDYCTHPHIRPVCLPTDTSEKFSGVDAILTGWGTTSSGGSLSSSMLDVTVKVLTNSQCKNDYSYASSMITSKMMCANVDGGGKDACQVTILETCRCLDACYRETQVVHCSLTWQTTIISR